MPDLVVHRVQAPVGCDECGQDLTVIRLTLGDRRNLTLRCPTHGVLHRERFRREHVRAFLNPGGLTDVGLIWAPA